MRSEIKAVSLVWLSRTGLTNLNSGEGGSNWIDVKKYRWQGQEFPYVSGQAMRFYLKEAIRREIEPEEACIADEQGENCGRIDKCLLCDLFGFMKTERKTATEKGTSIPRVSPTKVAPAMGLVPLDGTMVTDFLTRRHRKPEWEKPEGDIVNVELSVNIYKAGLCIDLRRIGREEEVIELERTEGKKPKAIQGVRLKEFINDKERARRVGLLLDAVKDFSDYSKQARLLTDFTPDLLLVSLQTNYSHRLQKALDLETDDNIKVSINRLDQVLKDIKTESAALFAGMLDSIVENAGNVREVLDQHGASVTTPREAIESAKKALEL